MGTDGASPNLVGRTHVLERAIELVTDRRIGAVILTGVSGAGKTMLADAIIEQLESNGWTGLTLSATEAAGAVPYSSVSSLIPDVLDQLDDPNGPGDRLAVQRGLESALGLDHGHRVVVVVNEPAAIDRTTCEILVHLAANERLTLVACQRPGVGMQETVRRLDPLSAQIIELEPLTFGETGELAGRLLGGPIGPGLTRTLYQRSCGHPAFVRDLVEWAVDHGRVRQVGGVYQLTGDMEISADLARHIMSGLGLLSAEEQLVMETLALVGPLGAADLTPVIDLDHLEAMEQRGLVVTSTDNRRLSIALTHPLHGEAIITNMSPLSLRSRRRQIHNLLTARPQRRTEDPLILLRLTIDAGGSVDTDELTAATYQAFTADRISDGAVFAATAHEQSPSEATLAAVAESLVRQGRFVEADEHLEQSAPPDRRLGEGPTRHPPIVEPVLGVRRHGDGTGNRRGLHQANLGRNGDRSR